MAFWLSHMVVPRVGKASERSLLSSLASGLPLLIPQGCLFPAVGFALRVSELGELLLL